MADRQRSSSRWAVTAFRKKAHIKQMVSVVYAAVEAKDFDVSPAEPVLAREHIHLVYPYSGV